MRLLRRGRRKRAGVRGRRLPGRRRGRRWRGLLAVSRGIRERVRAGSRQMLGGDSGRRRLLGNRPVGGRLLLRHPGWLGSGALVKGGRREVGTGRLGFMGEALGGVAECPDEVLEALPDGRGIVEPGDDGLRLGDQLIAQLRDPALSLGHQAVGVAACVLPVASRLGLGLVAKSRGLALDRIEDRAHAPGDLRRHRGHRSVGTRGGPRLPWRCFLFGHRGDWRSGDRRVSH